MKKILLLLCLLLNFNALAQNQPPSYPGWNCYFSNITDSLYVDKEHGKYYVTDGMYDSYVGVRFETYELADATAQVLNTMRRPPSNHMCQFSPGGKVFFTYIMASGEKPLPDETCVAFDYVSIRNNGEGKSYISSSSNQEMMVGPFESYDAARKAVTVIEGFAFTKFCTQKKSNLVHFRRKL